MIMLEEMVEVSAKIMEVVMVMLMVVMVMR